MDCESWSQACVEAYYASLDSGLAYAVGRNTGMLVYWMGRCFEEGKMK